MSETYQSKRQRRQRIMESIPVDLRLHVSLRNVEAVAALSPQAQSRLLEAIQAGLKRLPRAVDQLKNKPDTSVADLLNPPVQLVMETSSEDIQHELADLIQLCFPDMPRISAESLANAEVMGVVRNVMQVHHRLFASNHLRTDFVMTIMYALISQSLDRLDEIRSEMPANAQINPNPWRKQNA